MHKYRLIAGIILVAVSVVMFVLGEGSTVVRSALGTIGIVLIVVSKRKMRQENEEK